VLRLEANGPTSYVTALAFSPDGQTLYAGSWDKTVHVWRWDEAAHEFRLDPVATLRVPIGPGLDGAVNTIAVSPDGDWVAAAGTSPIKGAADFRRPGQVIPTLGGMTSEMRQDAGTIYVFNVHTGQTRSLRGHRGEVRALTFAPSAGDQPVLVSAAREWNETATHYEGVVRVWQAGMTPVRAACCRFPAAGPPGHWLKLAARRGRGRTPLQCDRLGRRRVSRVGRRPQPARRSSGTRTLRR
jgi:WD40 repeat protein